MKDFYKGVAVVLQCRLGSTRLPGKALLSLSGTPMVRYVMRGIKKIEATHYVLACDVGSFDMLKPLADAEGFTCIAGDENNVLSRFCLVIDKLNEISNEPIKVIVRVTADNPFIFVEAANDSIRRYFEEGEPDYFTLTGLPHGSGVELLKAESLMLASKRTDDPYDREHVGPAIYRHKDLFRCVRQVAPAIWYAPEVRTTVDEEADYKRAVYMVRALKEKGERADFTAQDVFGAYQYATRLILFYPSVRQGEGTGHLRRAIEIVKNLESDIRVAIYVPHKESLKNVAKDLLEALDDELIVQEIPSTVSLIVLDNFRTNEEEMRSLKKRAPVVAIDEGGAGRPYADFLLDVLPALKIEEGDDRLKFLANIEDIAFIPLPLNRKSDVIKKHKMIASETKVLVVFGGENSAKQAMPTAQALSEIGFDVTVVAKNLSFEDITRCSQQVKTYPEIENLREKLCNWDVVVTHYGFTAFEALVAGCLVLLLSPTPYHYKLGVAAGFSTIESIDPTIDDFKKVFASGLKIPKIVGTKCEQKSLSTFIRELFDAKRYTCPICGKDRSDNVAVRVPDKTVSYCDECHLHHLSFIVKKQSDYSESYFFDEYKAQYGKTYLEDFEYIKHLGMQRMKRITAIFDETFQKKVELNIFTTEKKLLDIGCAYGPFLEAAKDALWQPIGTDICAEAIEYVTNTLHLPAFTSAFPALPQSFEYIYKKQVTGSGYEKVQVPLEDGTFLGVTMWYVIEHFQDLDSVLSKVASLLMPGGIFAFSTPTISGITGKQSIYDFAYKSPIDHYSLWDAREVEKILEKYHFKLCKVVSVGHHPERFNMPFKVKKGGVLWRILDMISRKKNLGDGMEVYCIKRGVL